MTCADAVGRLIKLLWTLGILFLVPLAGAQEPPAEATFLEGRKLLNGDGVERDDKKAAELFLQAAEAGNYKAQHNLGSMYTEGRGVPQDQAQAILWIRKSAEQGTLASQLLLARILAGPKDAEPVDINEAVVWYEKAAAQGDLSAQIALGDLYHFNEKGVAADPAIAIKWIKMAADQGDITAQNNLGVFTENGLAIETNLPEAARLYRLAAERGDAKAQANLGRLYYSGLGVPEDHAQAYFWLTLSAGQGEVTATNLLEECGPTLTPEMRKEGERLLREYRDKQG